MHKGITEDHVTKGALGPLLWSSVLCGVLSTLLAFPGQRPAHWQGQCARPASMRQQAGTSWEKSQREQVQAALLPALLHSSWLSFPLSSLAPSVQTSESNL